MIEVEKEYGRLRPGSQPIEDPVARQLLAHGEGPSDAAYRVLRESHRARASGDCATAVKLGRQAETMLLAALSLDEERDPLKGLYSSLILCELKLNNAAGLASAAARLRGLVSLPPSDLTQDIWDKHVANATLGEPDHRAADRQRSGQRPGGRQPARRRGDAADAQGPEGVAFVEVQKEGYKKAFRAVEITDRPVRTVLRLVQRAHDRIEQAELQLKGLRMSEAELSERNGALSRLSQLARVETLVLLQVTGNRVKISFFDAEKGAVTGTPIDSPSIARAAGSRRWPSAPRPGAAGPGLDATAAAPSPARRDRRPRPCRRCLRIARRPPIGDRAARPPRPARTAGCPRRARPSSRPTSSPAASAPAPPGGPG